MAESTYVYAATLNHEDTVRIVRAVPGMAGGFLTASYDKMAKLWLHAGKGEVQCVATFAGHPGWVVNVVHVTIAGKPYIATAGWDKNFVIWDIETAEPQWMLDGHDDKVTCITQLPSGEIFTGGYDKAVVIWKDAQMVKKIVKHTAPVSCCCTLESNEVATGGADGCSLIHRWDAKGGLLGSYKGHSSGVRGVASVSASEFISCSNDASLILWSIQGRNIMRTFKGHANQVYSVAMLQTGEFVSGSEDKTLKVWRADGECVQSISMPSFVFSVTEAEGGDLAASCQDGTVRIFSRNPDRMGAPDDIKQFEETVASQKLNKGGLGGLDPKKIKDTNALQTPGQKDGEQLFVKSGTGVEVYSWNMGKRGWEKIGDVMNDAEESSGEPKPAAKVAFKGKEWDYVFDVDLTGDGKGMMKLPYNKGENPYEAAQRFIFDNAEAGVHQGFLDEIAKFIITNAEATGLEGANQENCHSDYAREAAAQQQGGHTMSNWEALKKMEQTGEQTAFSDYAKEAQNAAQASTSVADNMKRLAEQGGDVAFSTFAQEAEQLGAGKTVSAAADTTLPPGVAGAFVTHDRINAAGMTKKIRQQAAEHPGLDATQIDALCTAVEALAVAKLTPEGFPVEACAIVAKGWPPGQRFAIFDFLRQACLNEGLAKIVLEDETLRHAVFLFKLADSNAPAATGAEEGLCLKAASNLFASAAGRQHLNLHSASILAALGGVCEKRIKTGLRMANYF